MPLHLGLEDMEARNWIAWVFDLPGCYARATNREEAIALVPDAVNELIARLGRSALPACDIHPPFDYVIEEEFRASNSSPDYIVNAFFENDKLPLHVADVDYANRLLDLNRRELLELVAELPESELTRPIEGEVQQNILGILTHIGTAEWWYWDRLDMIFPRSERPKDWRELLHVVRDFTNTRLPHLVGSEIITEKWGELWSARKLLRRTIWHERVHTLQIARYLHSPHLR